MVAGLLTCCGGTNTKAPVMDPGDGGNYHPNLDASRIADVIDNPHLPLKVGSRWRYAGEVDGKPVVTEIVVTPDRKTVMGISAFVIRDTVTADGAVLEDTLDLFTQDLDGNVWYLGEDTKEYEDGAVSSTAGSWEAGVDGALPGIAMPATAKVGAVIRQEFSKDNAEDMMTIAAVDGTSTVTGTTYTGVVTTREWTPLEPDVVEQKSYAPGVGVIHEQTVAGGKDFSDLVEFVPGA